jgi:hypothetical protein
MDPSFLFTCELAGAKAGLSHFGTIPSQIVGDSHPIPLDPQKIQFNQIPLKKKGNSHEVPIQLTIRSWGFTPL